MDPANRAAFFHHGGKRATQEGKFGGIFILLYLDRPALFKEKSDHFPQAVMRGFTSDVPFVEGGHFVGHFLMDRLQSFVSNLVPDCLPRPG